MSKSQNPKLKKKRTEYVSLNVLPDDLWLKARQGDTIWEVLQNTDVELDGDCGGLGKCGKCKIRVLTSIGPPSEEEGEFLDQGEIDQGIRLACRTQIMEDMVIHIGDSGTEYIQILKSGHRPLFQLEPLVDKRFITLPAHLKEEGLSDLDRVKMAMGPDYLDLTATLSCLRSLPQLLAENESYGAALLHEKCLMDWQGWSKLGYGYGMVFDLGTTTLVGKLIDLADGIEIAAISRLNGQIKYGTNVISRIQYTQNNPHGLSRLHNLLIANLNRIIRRLLEVGGLEMNDIFVAVAAGNTIMQHFFMGLPTTGIAEAPFAPVLTDGMIVKAAEVGLQLHPEALLYTMPMRSGYIGGDLISVILASGAAEQEDEIILALDLGTNAEILLGNRKRMLTCSAAAGPALEGAKISHGMIAKDGAIEAVGFERGELHYRDVGNIKPKGLCGSGLVDLVAVLLQLGIIDEEGAIGPPKEKVAEALRSRIIERNGVNDFLIASAEESYDNKAIYLTQKDVRELQLAKAAVAAGVATLMDEMGIETRDIHHVYLAGALGNYINPYSALRIGLLPKVEPEIISSLGNAASTGASMVLLSKFYWQMANELSDFIEHVELSSRLDFNEYFIEQMDFPGKSSLDVHHKEVEEVMKTIQVKEVMTSNFPVMYSDMPVSEISDMSRSTGHHGFPVLDEEGHLIGVVTLADLATSLRNGTADLPIGNIVLQSPLVAYPDQSLFEVLEATDEDYGRIPVIDREDWGHLLGVLRRNDITKAYRKKLAESVKEAESLT
ncbi:MAG: ASKHA domain-containing protein [Chloroflexota bacterium]|nr:ASKHA domain-containing protein [Chloroflexota bacterium]